MIESEHSTPSQGRTRDARSLTEKREMKKKKKVECLQDLKPVKSGQDVEGAAAVDFCMWERAW